MVDISQYAVADDDLAGAVRDLLKRKRKFKVEAIADQLDVSPKRVRLALVKLRDAGFRIPEEVAGEVELVKIPPAGEERIHSLPLKLLDGDLVRFGVVSDTHLGSKECALDELHLAYDWFEREGIDRVLHAGDLVAGVDVFKGQVNELTHHTFEEQKDHAIKEYPCREGVTTHLIAGNHDLEGALGRVGADPVQGVSNQRDDLVYLGPYSAWLELGNGAYVHLLHGRGGMCVDGTTEILTRKGWQRFDALERGIDVATLNPQTHAFQWQRPLAYTDEPYSGPMLHFKARTFDLLVTPNHRMLARRYEPMLGRRFALYMPQKAHRRVSLEWQLLEAESLASATRQRWQFTQCASGFAGTPLPIIIDVPGLGPLPRSLLAQLVAWYVTEGHCQGIRRADGSLRLKQTAIAQHKAVNPVEHREIIDLARALGFAPTIDDRRVVISSAPLARWLVEQCGSGSASKHLPTWLKEAPAEELRGLLDIMLRADGSRNGPRGWVYRSISDQLADDVQEIAIKAGYGSTRVGDSVSVRSAQTMPTLNTPPRREQYDGRIYCVTVPNGVFLARRNGRTLWTGNSYAYSYRAQKLCEAYGAGRKPAALIVGHWHVQGNLEARGIQVMFPACFEWVSKQFGVRAGHRNSVGFHVVEARLADDGSIVEWTPRWKPLWEGREVRGFGA